MWYSLEPILPLCHQASPLSLHTVDIHLIHVLLHTHNTTYPSSVGNWDHGDVHIGMNYGNEGIENFEHMRNLGNFENMRNKGDFDCVGAL